MFNNALDIIKNFNKKHPYLMTIIILVIASSIGIAIQYSIDGRVIGSGFYTSISIALVSLISKWNKRRKD